MTSSVGWHDVKIAALGQVVTGKTPPSARPEFFGEAHPFVTPTDIDGMSRIVATDRFISDEGAAAFKNQMLPAGAVCFVCIGATIGKMCVVSRPSLTNQQINSIIVDEASHDPKFVYYALRQIAPDVKSLAGGAATPIINKSTFSDISIRVPALHEQRRIASILSAYDDLIENNTRRIAILEEMARRIYEEWFVRFRFPGHEGVRMVESELGVVPATWRVLPMSDLAEVIDCLHSKKPAEYEDGPGLMLQLFNIANDGILDLTKRYRVSAEDYSLWTSRMEAKEGDCVITNVGRVGAVAQIPRGVKAALGRNMTGVRAKKEAISPTYLIRYLLSSHMESEIVKKKDPGTIMDSLNVKGIVRLSVPVADAGTMQAFDQVAAPMRRQVEVLVQKNANLRTTRDLLLPKLISGELDVSEEPVPEALAA